MRSRARNLQPTEFAIAVLALVASLVCAPLAVHADAPSFVIPGGQDPLVGQLLGSNAVVGGCNFVSASIAATRIVARYECGAAARDIRIALTHPSTAGAGLARTRRFAISTESGDPPPALIEALRTRLSANEEPFVWISPGSDSRAENDDAESGGNRARSNQSTAGRRGLLRLGLVALAITFAIALGKRRGFVAVASLAAIVIVPVTLHSAGDAWLGAQQSGGGEAQGVVAIGGLLQCAVLALLWRRRIEPRPRDALVLFGYLASAAAIALALSIRSRTDEAPRFGATATWRSHGTIVETDARRARMRYRVNARGFRGSEWPEQPEPGTFRGVVIGDSFVTGFGAAWPDTISEQIQSRLRAVGTSTRLEVLNLGIPRSNLAQHIAVYQTARERLRPAFVVLCLTLPQSLSTWSAQEETADLQRVSALSIAGVMFGRTPAASWFAHRARPQTLDTAASGILDREMARLGEDRRRDGGPPLFIFTYAFDNRALELRVRTWRDTYLLAPINAPSESAVAFAGEPSAVANHAYAERIASGILEVPTLRAQLQP